MYVTKAMTIKKAVKLKHLAHSSKNRLQMYEELYQTGSLSATNPANQILRQDY